MNQGVLGIDRISALRRGSEMEFYQISGLGEALFFLFWMFREIACEFGSYVGEWRVSDA